MISLHRHIPSYYLRLVNVRSFFANKSAEGNQYSAESVLKIIKHAGLKAEIKKRVYPHILRHSYATHQLEQGIDIRYIQQWLGHESIKTTERCAHVSEQNINNFKNPIDDLI